MISLFLLVEVDQQVEAATFGRPSYFLHCSLGQLELGPFDHFVRVTSSYITIEEFVCFRRSRFRFHMVFYSEVYNETGILQLRRELRHMGTQCRATCIKRYLILKMNYFCCQVSLHKLIKQCLEQG